MNTGNKASKAKSFEAVLKEELCEIGSLRSMRNLPDLKAPDENDVYTKAHAMKLIGLAFSGGGIRSATFNLGVLRALAELKLLKQIDYLSTVSGGGYIGSWLTAWISREKSIDSVQEKLSSRVATGSKTEEHRPVFFLRQYSNYLTPRAGAFSADTWAAISTYLRNLILNLGVFFPLFLAILLLPVLLIVWFDATLFYAGIRASQLFIEAVMTLGIAVFFISSNLMYKPGSKGRVPWYASQKNILFLVVLPIVISSLLGALWLWRYGADIKHWYKYIAFAGVSYLAFWILGWFNGQTYAMEDMEEPTDLFRKTSTTPRTARKVKEKLTRILNVAPKELTIYFLSVVALPGLWFLFLAGVRPLLRLFESRDPANIWYIITIGMPLLILVDMAAVTFQIGFMGSDAPEDVREWWSRLGGLLFIIMMVWVGFFGIIIVGPPVLILGRRIGISLIASGWLFSTAAGVFLGKSSLTGKEGSKPWVELVAKIAPYVFIAGLLLFCSSVLSGVCVYLSHLWTDYWKALGNPELTLTGLLMINTYFLSSVDQFKFIIVFLASAGLFLLFSWRVDINIFSMHLLYRNRLVRCYLGASNEQRSPHPFYGFDPNDDIGMHHLNSDNSYSGPFPIINATLNLVGGNELAWQQRKAASFVFTPKYSGYELVKAKKKPNDKEIKLSNTAIAGYQGTREYANRGVMLGEAMAISGAAASPNMGYHSSRPLAFLMTVFNVRLGWWVGNPQFQAWARKGTPWGIWYLFAELFGLTRDDSKYVYLSDGGHFENLGMYELVRRKCRVILLFDAGCDPDFTFDDLGNAIRKVRIDFGVSIEMEDGHLKDIADGKRHYAAGNVYYPGNDGQDGFNGTLIYIKPNICGDEPGDVMSYKAKDDKFPHQSTADQWFDETQFEAYRMLGYHSMRKVAGDGWKGSTIDDLILEARRQYQCQETTHI